MNEYLRQRDKSYVSAKISEVNPITLTDTIGALTIVDNTMANSQIGPLYTSLVPNSYSIFLDKIFLAGGFGFSSYNNYETAAYIINSYDAVYSYLIDLINNNALNNFSFEYSYTHSSNKFCEQYNSYGCLTAYKYFDLSYENNSYILDVLNNNNITHFENIYLSYSIDDEEVKKSFNEVIYAEPTQSINITYSLKNTNSILTKNDIINSSPNIYINSNYVDLNSLDNLTIEGILSIEEKNTFYTENLSIETKRNNAYIYQKVYQNALKWRYKVSAFNGRFENIEINKISNINYSKFDTIKFSNSDIYTILSNDSDIEATLIDIIEELADEEESTFVYLDDYLDIEFRGDGYYDSNSNLIYSNDYIIVKGLINLRFFFNGLENNNWGKLVIQTQNSQNYTIYQSPQKYIGKHTWQIRYE